MEYAVGWGTLALINAGPSAARIVPQLAEAQRMAREWVEKRKGK